MKYKNILIKNILTLHIIILLISVKCIENEITNNKEKKIKRMLVFMFPGGKTHNYVLQNLFDYSLSHEDKYKYEYHILVHKIDEKVWLNKVKENPSSYKIYPYGDVVEYKKLFEEGIEDMNDNPTSGYSGFNRAILLNIKHFLESDILKEFKAKQKEYNEKYNEDYFHMVTSDTPNFIHKLLYQELNIKLSLYLVPALIPQIFYSNFEMNPSYFPTIGSTFTDEMTFIERFQNSFIQNLMQIIFHFFKMYQSQLINSYNYDIDNNAHIIDSFHMFQYPLGLGFPFSIPPNWVLLNSITSKPYQKINDKSIDSFLNKYKKNIYFSSGTIMKAFLSLNDYVEIFKYLKGRNIGVILSVREEQMNDNEIKLLPDNVYSSRWLDQNNLLGDNRINLFVTHGGYNSVLESVYHGKPMVVLGIGLDHYNVASFIKKRKIGEVFQRKNSINKDAIINSIENVLKDKEFSDNAIQIGKIMEDLKDPREEFKYWIDFGYSNGYSSLYIPSYKFKFSWIIVNGYDVALVWLLILLIIILIIKKIINCIHNCLCGKCENKHKRNKHYKFD